VPVSHIAAILASRFPLDVPVTWSRGEEAIVLAIRLPRVLSGAVVGTALALAGAAFQGLFRNPMADPYVLGVSSGAALGAAVGMITSSSASFLGVGTVPAFAFCGALGSIFLVYNLARVGGRVPVMTLLLAGIAVAALLQAAVSLLMVVAHEKLEQIVFWIMGGLAASRWGELAAALPYVAVGSGVILAYARDLNALLLGEESAHHLGVEVERCKKVVIAAGALVTAAAVSISGSIAFVGLVVPHAMRLVVGPDHRVLLPASALAGAIALVAADALARTAMAPSEIPVGIIMALSGGPFFIYLLRRTKARRGL